MRAMAYKITCVSIVYWTLCSEHTKAPRHGFCEGNSPVTGDFPAQRAISAESVSIWWRLLLCRMVIHHNTLMGNTKFSGIDIFNKAIVV